MLLLYSRFEIYRNYSVFRIYITHVCHYDDIIAGVQRIYNKLCSFRLDCIGNIQISDRNFCRDDILFYYGSFIEIHHRESDIFESSILLKVPKTKVELYDIKI